LLTAGDRTLCIVIYFLQMHIVWMFCKHRCVIW